MNGLNSPKKKENYNRCQITWIIINLRTQMYRCDHRYQVGFERESSSLEDNWVAITTPHMFVTIYMFYSRFQLTFHCNIPKFVAKFGSSLRSSKVHFRIRKPVCKQRLWLVPELSEANQMLSLQTGLRILKWTFELRNEFPNFATKFGMLQWKVTWNRL